MENNDARTIMEFLVQRIVRHVGPGYKIRYVIRWYVHGPHEDIVEPASHVLQHFIVCYWSQLNREAPRNRGN